MGNKLQKNNEFGDIMINTSKITYRAGEQVNGVINLNLKKSFPSSSIYLIISGVEKVKLTDYVSSSGDDNSDVDIYTD